MPVTVSLTAFSPFIPLNVEDSSLPATVLRFAVKNTGAKTANVELAGWLENAAVWAAASRTWGSGATEWFGQQIRLLHGTAEEAPRKDVAPKRADILFEDFEQGYGKWQVEGEAFGTEPPTGTLPGQQTVSGFQGKHLVNSFQGGDDTVGKLTSHPFPSSGRTSTF